MATSHGIAFNDAPTGAPATQDYTKASLGTVKGAIFLGSEDTAVNTNFDDVQWHIGATDLSAVNGFLVGGNYEDNQVTSDSKTLMHATRLLGFADAGTDGEDEGCNFDSTITDGVRVNWTNVQSARLCTSILFKEGVDNVDVQLVTLNGTGSTTISGVGFNPDVVICISTGKDSVSFGPNTLNYGVQFYKQTSNAYAGTYLSGLNNDTTPDSSMYYTTSAIGGNVGTASGALDDEYTLSNFGADGFNANKVAQTTARVAMFISIGLASGYSASVGTVTAPVLTGVTSLISGLDHTPQIALFAATGYTGIDGGVGTGICSLCFGALDADAEVNMGGWIEDAGGATQNTNAGGWHRNDSSIYIFNGTTVRSQATFDSFQTDGVDLNFTTATDAIKIAYLTIGPDIAASTGLSSRHALGRGISRGTARGIG